MQIRRFLRDCTLAPEEVERLNRAYAYALRSRLQKIKYDGFRLASSATATAFG